MSLATVLIVEDDPALREALSDTLELAGYPICVAEEGGAAINLLQQRSVGMVVSDVQMHPMDGHTLLRKIRERYPDLPVLLMTAYGTIEKAVMAMHDGAVDYLTKPFEAEVLVSKVASHIRTVVGPVLDGPVAEDLRSREVLDLALRVAGSDATVLLHGESGTGKEVYARYIHQHSMRKEGPFVAINCAAIPENMLEAVLFGYEKGAFTGAYQATAGKFEQAQGGTLLLDEISEMSLALQAKLLRVLQEKELERLGGRKLIELDVRVLATTNRKLREEVSAGRFREDLFYRLNVFPLSLPPLRERQRDILPLALHLLQQNLRTGQTLPNLSDEAKQRLLVHPWPGNVRELDNLMQRALILDSDGVIDADELCFESEGAESTPAQASQRSHPGRLPEDLRSVEEQMILDALEEGRGSRKAVASRLGISERTLRYKIARMRDAGVTIPG
ncbi:MAG: sigma-54 dependent transcriptional regulator [Candidatus Thiodiazotropha endolucinida]|uniref:Sigma-54 dependent transcriptional regulator n=1 Tax=Candidatus Thiodiazotropha taylori TaxID=2792791 RepID=A0A9E4TSB1_9GAMM|nr:sigma-54 dependent transcriptional regulator [Candidatus Thiodiazotropha sp. (ex Codakia orbicularis)]MBT3094168.1 sigma-54 dependent transcriptional regulator [Candidatus Thiodiazotropha sp. (ex Lucina pensylvanica)]MBV2124826.1 sigma-54 dependent transcriptional regulator [Candidatus Thiodiazotropha taylori]MCG7860863.1 sigma-54 dependent transcriptional regulator [Candidatus Thiodiazotropha endolucinida]MCG7952548.1 sigma-54 dependent transcriptional regulator [Candidatus Thiodiazotropha 